MISFTAQDALAHGTVLQQETVPGTRDTIRLIEMRDPADGRLRYVTPITGPRGGIRLHGICCTNRDGAEDWIAARVGRITWLESMTRGGRAA